MFTPEKMEQIHVVFSHKDVDKVADTIVRLGSLQMIDSAEVESWAQNLSRAGTGEETIEMRNRQEKVEGTLKGLGLSEHFEGIAPAKGEWESLDKRIMEIEHHLREEIESREEIEKEFSRLKELKSRMTEVPNFLFPLKRRETYSYLAVETGQVAEVNMEILQKRLEPVLHVLSVVSSFGGMKTILIVALKRDRERMQSALREAGFQPLDLEKEDLTISPEILKEIDEKIDQVQKKLVAVDEKLQKMARDQILFLRSVLYRIRREILKQRILKYFRKTERTYLLSGWLPINQRDTFIREIRRVTQNRCVIERVSAEDITSVREGKLQVPVQLKNPALFKPFELITGAYGVPAYRTIDPTPFLAISFLLMFGMMFGDVGHGLVLGLLGGFLAFKGKREMHRSAGALLFYGGCASIVFGFLFGSIFGVENLLPTLWVKPMESITQLFRVAIFFGIGMIFMAIMINILNGIRKKDFLSLVFDKAGLLTGILYWCGIVIATRIVTSKAESREELPFLIPVLMLSSVVLLFFREPIIHLIQGKRKLFPEGFATGLMGGIVEIFEIILGFLANTVSFIRVAAFGLAHAGLFMAIFTLSDAVKGIAGGLISVLVLVIGNAGIIALEGLVVTIQAVRLEFYEFFSRFFERSSVGYRPLRVELGDS